tara:strand:+ start:5633 stop:5929 length:297 start_codon:yes stop_codon:yes gene_type:complete
MEDLRKNNSVKKKSKFNLKFWWLKNKNILKLFALIGVVFFIIVKPDIIGMYIGTWFNMLITSFSNNISVTNNQWGIILVTALVVAICYRLLSQRRSKN